LTTLRARSLRKENLMADRANSAPLPDALNPRFIFSLTRSELLVDAIKGRLDLDRLARRELANRGLDASGKWVGFAEARRCHGLRED
jgi:hypothetical protein